ncbi:class 1 fructose-bisphosphatase [Phyllobacterium sp. 21LDTY02-6]|uniref:class 1 fructose-bisphosphatase n=1 Tax=unclassified Phyllobacterium TaxID=2638441 RepID=UPI002021EBFD|nr:MULTISPECIES: class 1 fructose-bisphosphatase [unclassified Phyllobacterium]MCO4318164.1 class 1 fructose-bisphosphatase [Phyllobacterium sp. 21LDTY02-6]MCX8280158.1 class 1 fructose-bisphosphatase [Phyllobacterium sp. 0TCS1.6C]MCX8294280.1 class 1 fructose-bisphosphatase [Phyllobacterium sp. 0TCS1.6A]
MTTATLDAFLGSYAKDEDPSRVSVSSVVRQLALTAVKIRGFINQGALGKAFSNGGGSVNADGDTQKALDVFADDMFLQAVREAPVALYGSEELPTPAVLATDARLALAIDPLDGSSNIDTNVSIGTIFSILPVVGDPEKDPLASFLQSGSNQLAAGFFIYGPQLALVLTLGSGTHIFVFSSRLGTFVQAYESVAIESRAHEFAINAANYRHWDEAVRLYIDDCLKGSEGPRGREFNMRWIASLVAEAYRILTRGGVFLYPGDKRKTYGEGRLRLVYEANPIAFLIEQAGGAATDTVNRILDIVPHAMHQRVPLVFGAAREVARIGRYHTDPSNIGERAPLFSNRGLFRV